MKNKILGLITAEFIKPRNEKLKETRQEISRLSVEHDSALKEGYRKRERFDRVRRAWRISSEINLLRKLQKNIEAIE